MAFVDLTLAQTKMRRIREKGELIPVQFGFRSWNDYDSGKWIMGSKKCTLLIGGEPNHGKSYVTNELVMQLIEKHGFKVALFSTESGDVEKIFTHFCGLYIGKPYSKLRPDGKPNPYAMSDEEAVIAEHFLSDKLFVFRQDRKNNSYQSLENIYKELKKTEDLYHFKFDSLVIDPVYDVDDFEPKASEVLKVLNRFNLEAEENNRFDIMVNHVAETSKITDKNGNRKKLIALADEFYGGKNNQRKAMLMALVHRPLPNLNPETPEEYVAENQTDIHILKVKPEGIAKFGKYSIFYDWKSRRYYEHYEGSYDFAECTRFRYELPQEKALPTIDTSDAFGEEDFEQTQLPF